MAIPLLFAVTDHHHESCGTPPQVDTSDRNKYFGYFENPHGEQAVFIYDYTTKTATLQTGDCGWDQIFEIHDGQIVDLILNGPERRWLEACWHAATYHNAPLASAEAQHD